MSYFKSTVIVMVKNSPVAISDWKVTLIGSRFTSPAESRYKPIEGEALAVAEGLDKTRFFTLGCSNLTVAVDHKPLLKYSVIVASRTYLMHVCSI